MRPKSFPLIRHFAVWPLAVVCATYSAQSYSAISSDQLTLDVSYNDNVGLTNWEEDRISDQVIDLSFARAYRETLDVSQSIFFGAELRAREYTDYPCDQFSVVAQLGYEKKFGLGFDKPRLTLFWRGARHEYPQGARDGYSNELSARISKPLSEHLDFSAGISKSWEIPDETVDNSSSYASHYPSDMYDYAPVPSDVFNLESLNLDLAIEFYANQRWSFPASLNYTDGDFVSVSRARMASFVYADAVMPDEAVGPDWYAYRSEGDAWTLGLGASRLMDDGSLLNFELELSSAEVAGNIEYERNIARISWSKSW